jgi:hypothetical protein
MARQDRMSSNKTIRLGLNRRHILLMKALEVESRLIVLCRMLVNLELTWCFRLSLFFGKQYLSAARWCTFLTDMGKLT